MTRHRPLRVLVATDGSRHARAAVTTTVHFPWPDGTIVRAVVARRTGADYRRSLLLAALDRSADLAAANARRVLSRRWPDVHVEVVDATPVAGILREAERFGADVIVVGWRGHGAVRRLLMGSVSRGVVRGARCAVLVARRPQRVRSLVVGLDGSATAERALALVARLAAPPDGRATVVTAVEVMHAPTSGRVPGAAAIAKEIKRLNRQRAQRATRALNRAAARLDRKGWRTRARLTRGEPLNDLLGAVGAARAQLLVVGARETSGVARALLGSVAEGALNRNPAGTLIVR